MIRWNSINVPRRGAFVAVLLALVPLESRAEVFCVDSASELIAALSIAQLIPEPNVIRVEQGSYSITEGPGSETDQGYFAYTHDLYISGGWNGGCSHRTIDPSLTTINGHGAAASFWEFKSVDEGADITLDGFRFLNTAGIHFNWQPGCDSSGSVTTVRRNIIEGSVNEYFGALSLPGRCMLYRVENNLIINGSFGGIWVNCGDSMRYQITNNTILGTSDDAIAVGSNCASEPLGLNSLSNNILDDLRLSGATPVAFNNYWESLATPNGGGLFPGSSGNSMLDPQLDSQFRPIEPTSPAINSGTGDVPGGLPGTDLEGNPRTVGGTPDRGAYESSVVPPGPFVLTVTSNSNSGAGSLRAVIDQANASSGLNLIQFDIPGTCPRLITLAAPLPDLTEDVIINGFSQPDSAWNTFDFGNNANLCIGVVGSQLVDVPYALRVPSNSSATLKVRGIGFGGFDDGGGLFGEAAIYLQGGSGHEVQGNQFGGPFHATTLAGNSEGIRLMNNATSALIGGSSPGHRNTISGSSFAGVHVIGTASGGHQIINNYIGTNPAGLSAVGNLDGIRLVQSADNDVLDNLVSGNARDGVVIVGEQATSNLVAGNHIGGRRGGFYLCGVPPLPACPPTMTNRKGIFIDSGASNNTIGVGGVDGAPNQIRFSTQHGIRILSGTRNRMLSNTLWDNGSVASEYEIDLGSFGFDAIDADCGAVADAKANRGQNRPVLESALGGASEQSVVFAGELSSCTHDGGFSSVYRIQLFASNACDGNGAGPGQYFLGDVNVVMPGPVQTDATVAFSGELEHPWLDLEGKYITATATDLLGNTSEFSQCVQVQGSDALFHDRFEQ